jgi:hypothetical protein
MPKTPSLPIMPAPFLSALVGQDSIFDLDLQ